MTLGEEPRVDPVSGDDEYLVAIVFDKPGRASEVLVNLMNLAQEGAVRLSDAVVVTKGDDGRGRVQQTVEITPARGALIGGWLGLFAGLFIGPLAIAGGAAAGAIYGKLVDRGLDDGWIKQMAEWLEPGGSALLLLCSISDQPTPAARAAPLRGQARHHRPPRAHPDRGRGRPARPPRWLAQARALDTARQLGSAA
jgi:uncharacterized membrane protein